MSEEVKKTRKPRAPRIQVPKAPKPEAPKRPRGRPAKIQPKPVPLEGPTAEIFGQTILSAIVDPTVADTSCHCDALRRVDTLRRSATTDHLRIGFVWGSERLQIEASAVTAAAIITAMLRGYNITSN